MVTHSSSFFLLPILLLLAANAIYNDQSSLLSTVVVVEAFSSPHTAATTTPLIIMRQQQHKLSSTSSSRQHKNKAGSYNILQATSADDNDEQHAEEHEEQVVGAVKSAYEENLDDDEETARQTLPPPSSIAAASTSTSSSLQEIALLVFPLLLIYISNQWSRYSISYLVDFSSTTNDVASSTATAATATAFTAMNIDLQFTKSQYGLLASTAFTILFAVSSLIAGNLADKYNRKTLTLLSSSVWIMTTLYSSTVHTYNEVLIARIVMGGACAFAAPVAYTLIADKISNDKLALSNSLYGSGVYLGGALSSLSLVLDTSIGWRGTLDVIGVFGIVSVIVGVVLLPSDDGRVRMRDGTDDEVVVTMDSSQDGDETMAAAVTTTTTSTTTTRIEEEETTFINNIGQILSIPRVQYIFIASFFRFCAGLLIGVWAAPYFKQAFPNDATQYAVVNAFIVGGVGMTSGIMGGYIADGLGMWIKNGYNSNIGEEATSFGNEEEGEQGGDVGVMMSSPPSSSSRVSSILRDNFDEETIRLLLPIVGSLLAIPAWYQTTHAGAKFEASMFWLAVEYLVAECWFGPTIAVLQSTVGASRTGTAQGLFVLTGALANSAPTLLGWIYGNKVIDTTASSSEVLANLLSLGVCTGYLLSSVFFLISINSAKQSGRGLQRIAQNVDEDSSL
jgi:MFS family permease